MRTNAGFTAKLDSIDQSALLPVDSIVMTGDALHFEIAAVKGVFDGKVSGARIEGRWTQEGATQPLTFSREAGAANSTPSKRPLDAPVEVLVPSIPIPFRADDRTHLFYELHITNFARNDVKLKRVEIGDGQRSLATLDSTGLGEMCAHPGVAEPRESDRRLISAGRRAVVYVWISTDGGAPKGLEHKITLQVAGVDEDLTVSAARVAVATSAKLPIIGAPLRGSSWLAANGPSNESHHRRAILPVAGRAHISQRFAIDWIKLGADGKTFTGNPSSNASYHAYGERAFAVADGVVTAVKDGLAENAPGSTRAVPITLETIGGNHVVVDMNSGFFAFWAHLQPGSIKVKVGERVKRGQALGLVGNSGNSTEPHLHFHVSDASSPLGSEGAPYAFESFESRPKARQGENAGAGPATRRARQLPTEDQTISFP